MGWAAAPFENAPDNTGSELALVAIAATALATAAAMARAFWAGDSPRALRWLLVSLASFAAWLVAMPPSG